MSQAEVEKYIKETVKSVDKMQRQLFGNLEKSNDIMEMLSSYIDSNTELFFAGKTAEPTNHDMFKWLLAKNIKQTKDLLELIEFHEMERMHID